MKLGRPVWLVSGGSNPTGPSNRQTKSVGRGLISKSSRDVSRVQIKKVRKQIQAIIFLEVHVPLL